MQSKLTVSSLRPPIKQGFPDRSLSAMRPSVCSLNVSEFAIRSDRLHVPNAAAEPRFDSVLPDTASFPIGSPEPRLRSFYFPLGAVESVVAEPNPSEAFRDRRQRSATRDHRSQTRLQPPADVIKLQDRLFYRLQPPLETIFSGGNFNLPFEPFPYQWQGVAFLATRQAALLADEMGLGKTMQAITALRLLVRQGDVRSVLLVCPKPLMSNWMAEFALWAPEIPVAQIDGPAATRTWQWGRTETPVKIANYELLVRDVEEVAQQTFDLVVLDEAQRIKNPDSVTSRTVQALQRSRSWALTGTPIENSARDLVAISSFLGTGLLSEDMTPPQMAHASQDLLIRRTKEQVLPQLPPKLVRDAVLELSPEQQHSYTLAETEGELRLSHLGDSVTIQHVLELVTRLKQICNCDYATGESSKLERLRADLEEVTASGKQVLVFSQWVRTLKWLADQLQEFSPLEYHGMVPARQREQTIRRFRERPEHRVLLMSYGSGGVGLNLQFSQYVFLFDRWWNPAVEEQAINRAHRIGSKTAVTVTRFLTRGTIEERIDGILRDKRAIFQSVLDGAPTVGELSLNREEIFGLFCIGKHAPRRSG